MARRPGGAGGGRRASRGRGAGGAGGAGRGRGADEAVEVSDSSHKVLWKSVDVQTYVETMQLLYRKPPGTRVLVPQLSKVKSCVSEDEAGAPIKAVLLGVMQHATRVVEENTKAFNLEARKADAKERIEAETKAKAKDEAEAEVEVEVASDAEGDAEGDGEGKGVGETKSDDINAGAGGRPLGSSGHTWDAYRIRTSVSVLLAVYAATPIPSQTKLDVLLVGKKELQDAVEASDPEEFSEYPRGVCVIDRVDNRELERTVSRHQIVLEGTYPGVQGASGVRLIVLPGYIEHVRAQPSAENLTQEPVDGSDLGSAEEDVIAWQHPCNNKYMCASVASLVTFDRDTGGCTLHMGTKARGVFLGMLNTWVESLNLWLNTFLGPNRSSPLPQDVCEDSVSVGGAFGAIVAAITTQIVAWFVSTHTGTSHATSGTLEAAVALAVKRATAEAMFTHSFWVHSGVFGPAWNFSDHLEWREVEGALDGANHVVSMRKASLLDTAPWVGAMAQTRRHYRLRAPFSEDQAWAPMFLRSLFSWCPYRVQEEALKHTIIPVTIPVEGDPGVLGDADTGTGGGAGTGADGGGGSRDVNPHDKRFPVPHTTESRTWEVTCGPAPALPEAVPETVDEFLEETDKHLNMFETALLVSTDLKKKKAKGGVLDPAAVPVDASDVDEDE